MLQSDQFVVNEAWIVFKLNDAPIRTEQDGDFNFLALMDAASCFILGSANVSTRQAEASQFESRRLLQNAQTHKKRWPKTLYVPVELSEMHLIAESERLGITVVRVEETQLLPFISEAQEGFRERFGGQRIQ